MKQTSFFLLFVGLSFVAQAQEVVFDTNYYAPPPVVRERVLNADPDHNNQRFKNGRRSTNRRDLLKQYRETQAWYLGAEVSSRSDESQLSNSFDQIVSNPTQTKVNWSVLAGYLYRNAWGVETGYAQAPTHLTISIRNGGADPLVYNYQNNGYGIPLRFKRRLGSSRRASNGAGFWLTGGVWLIPNGDGQTGNFRLFGYLPHGRARPDTLRLTNTTTVTKQITGLAELGLDYTARLSSVLEMSFFARKYWGLGNALQADLVYTVNTTARQLATITADGSGWGFGITFRYIYSKQHEVKTKSPPFNNNL